VNELCHEVAFRNMSEETKRNLSITQKYTIALGSGVIAGFAAAILSHVRFYPASLTLKLINFEFCSLLTHSSLKSTKVVHLSC
jgi:solute carrier family 25 phosphate transporter 3